MAREKIEVFLHPHDYHKLTHISTDGDMVDEHIYHRTIAQFLQEIKKQYGIAIGPDDVDFHLSGELNPEDLFAWRIACDNGSILVPEDNTDQCLFERVKIPSWIQESALTTRKN